MNYRETRFCENLNIAQFDTAGEFEIPILKPCELSPCEFVGFNFAKSSKNKDQKGIHFLSTTISLNGYGGSLHKTLGCLESSSAL